IHNRLQKLKMVMSKNVMMLVMVMMVMMMVVMVTAGPAVMTQGSNQLLLREERSANPFLQQVGPQGNCCCGCCPRCCCYA
ncbi:hypothetical protein Pcinc_041647, partial [Petrolisthes cinctipes]